MIWKPVMHKHEYFSDSEAWYAKTYVIIVKKLLLKENLNSIESIEKFLTKFKKNINLVKGDTNKTLKLADLSKIDFAFIDGGHSYATTYSDLSILYSAMKNKSKTIVCDDYIDTTYIIEVKKAVDDFVKKNR